VAGFMNCCRIQTGFLAHRSSSTSGSARSGRSSTGVPSDKNSWILMGSALAWDPAPEEVDAWEATR